MSTRIEICGGIASGKTTLARLVASQPRSVLALEDFRANPFWALSYEQPHKFTLEKNVCFIAQHTGAIKAAGNSRLLVCDYAVVQDIAYANMQRAARHARVMKMLFDDLYSPLPAPQVIVYLRCSAAVQLERIRNRARPEETSITIDYLEELNRRIEEVLSQDLIKASIKTIDSGETNFAKNRAVAEALKNELVSIAGRSRSNDHGLAREKSPHNRR